MILTEVREWLETKSAIRHYLRGKIFYGRAPQGVTRPYLIINRVAGTRTYHLLNEADATHDVVQVDVYDTNPQRCEDIAEAIRLVMSGTHNSIWGATYIMAARIIREDSDQDRPQDGSDTWVYRISRDYEISHREPVPTQ